MQCMNKVRERKMQDERHQKNEDATPIRTNFY